MFINSILIEPKQISDSFKYLKSKFPEGTQFVGDGGGMGWWTSIRDTVVQAAPVIVAVAAPELLPAIGEAYGLTGTAAAAAGAATISSGTALASGATPEQAVKAGAAAAAGAGVGAEAAESIGQTGAAAAAGGTTGGVSAALNKGDVVKGATQGAIVGGGAQAITGGISDAYKQSQIDASKQPGYVGDVNYSLSPVQKGGGQGLRATLDTTPYTSDGSVNYNLAVSSGAPGLKATTSPVGYELAQETGGGQGIKGQPADAFSPPSGLSPETQRALKSTIGAGLSSLFSSSPSSSSPAAQTSQAAISGGQVSSGATTGLTGERAAGGIEGTETGGKRKNVWNEESLRLKDALGL